MTNKEEELKLLMDKGLTQEDLERMSRHFDEMLLDSEFVEFIRIVELLKTHTIDYNSRLLIARLEEMYYSICKRILVRGYDMGIRDTVKAYEREYPQLRDA